MDSLSDKLKTMGVSIGANRLPVPGRTIPVEEAVAGEIRPTPLGETYLVKARYGPDYRHGPRTLAIRHPLDTLAVWAKDPDLVAKPLESIAFLDTETSGLAGGAGTFAFMIGVGRFIDGEFKLIQFFLRDPAEEPAMLAALESFLTPCYTLVTFNGKSFDLPLLQTRFITNGWEHPWKPKAHIDLLHMARRLWRHRLTSRALGDLETHILDVSRTEEEVPGWLVPQMYIDYLRTKDARPMRGVFYHNEIDILSMAVLMDHMAEMLDQSPAAVKGDVNDILAIGKLHEDIGQIDRAKGFYEHSLNADEQSAGSSEARKRLSFIHKRSGNFDTAVALWEIAAGLDEIYAFEELAKYYEHQVSDYSAAMNWTQAGLEVIASDGFSEFDRVYQNEAFEHRFARLERRIARHQ